MPLSSYRQFDAALTHAAQSVERTMDRLLPKGETGEARVFEAMRYSSLGGGKRLRAFFVLAGATLFKVAALSALRTASAVEFVHAYSLIHDDLPAMDDDDLRRGRPSCPATPCRRLPSRCWRMRTRTATPSCARCWWPSSPRRSAPTAWSADRCS